MYEAQVLEDAQRVIGGQKVDIVEALVRGYDLMHYQKGLKKEKVALAKQKIIFYLSYIKSLWTNEMREQMSNEFQGFRNLYI